MHHLLEGDVDTVTSDNSYSTIMEHKVVCLDEIMTEYTALSDPNRSTETLFDLLDSVWDEFYNPTGVVNDPNYPNSHPREGERIKGGLEKYSDNDLKNELARRSVREKIKKLPKYLQGETAAKNGDNYIITDVWGNITHGVTVSPTYLCVRPIVENNTPYMLFIGEPDYEGDDLTEDYLTSIYVCDHLNIVIAGVKKDKMRVKIMEDEFSVDLEIIKHSDKLTLNVRETKE